MELPGRRNIEPRCLSSCGMAAQCRNMGGWAESMMKQVGGIKDGLGRLLPMWQSSFNDIKMWYR